MFVYLLSSLGQSLCHVVLNDSRKLYFHLPDGLLWCFVVALVCQYQFRYFVVFDVTPLNSIGRCLYAMVD